jgi:1-acyl-sn-glycerol-3-phosphate acyltransferase
MRNFAFRIAYWAATLFFALLATPLALLPQRQPMTLWIRLYARTMLALMRHVAGVRVEVRGREKLPPGPCIIAAKHQSWGDGFVMMAAIDDLAFVTGDHLLKFPLVGGILRKLGAIIVDNCGGAHARARLVDQELEGALDEGRRILIYPEGHLTPVGERRRYKKGVFHMYAAYGRSAAPVATNLGQFWPEQEWTLKPGVAIVEFLDPIAPGLDKDIFMERLETAIETRSRALAGLTGPLPAPIPDPPRPEARTARNRSAEA